MPYPYTIDSPDAPTHRVKSGQVEVPLSKAEKQAEVDEWNAAEAERLAGLWLEDRREEYATLLPIEAQLEALLEAHLGDPTKLDALGAEYQAIKARHPKP